MAKSITPVASESFVRALTAFRNRLEPHELASFQCTHLEDFKSSLDAIQQRQELQKNVLGISRLKGYLEAIEQLGKIVEVFLNVSDAVAFVWGPVKLVLQTTSTWTHAFDQLLDSYQCLGEHFPLIAQYESLFGTDPKMQRILEFLYLDILEFHRRALPFLRQKVWKQLFRSAWNDFTARFNEITLSIQRHARMLEAQAHLIHFENDSATRASLIHLENEQRTVLEKFERVEQERKSANFHAVRQWIGATSTEYVHREACERWSFYKGTGQWILQEKQILHWMNEDIPKDSMLWLHGIPGAGKTVLASVIIESCKKVKEAQVINFYCRFDDEQTNKCLPILKGLLAQVIVHCEDLVPFFLEKSRECREPVITDDKIAKDLFEAACYSGQRLYIILDGLDECSHTDRRRLLGFLTSLAKKIDAYEPGKLRILVTSQSESDIARSLSYADYFNLLPAHNQKDISIFVSALTQSIQQKFGLSGEQRQFIENQVNYRAAGQFVYARLVLENLLAQANTADLVGEIHLSPFPKELMEAYQRILDRIQRYSTTREWQYVQKILGWMVCAARPMKWNEMQAGLSVDLDNGTVDFDGKSLRFDMKDVCGSLVNVDDHGRTMLIHSTAKTFIDESKHVVAELVELELSTLCLQYLTLPCFDADLSEADLTRYVRTGQFAFQDYAIAKWEYHFRRATHFMLKVWQTRDQPEYEYRSQVFSEAIVDFSISYEDDFLPPEDTTKDNDRETPTFMEPLRELGVYDLAMRIFDHLNRHRTTSQTAYNEISLQRLKKAYDRSCSEIESLPLAEDIHSHHTPGMTSFYGTDRFKCPKLTCYNFHQGFSSAKNRQTHLDRHTRPFQCPVIDCNAQDFGFISRNNLDMHIRTYHPELEDTTKTFPVHKNAEEEQFRYKCQICQKKFSRNNILKDHLLVHQGQKPHQCKRCGKAFTRKNDRDRHERTIHAQRARLDKSFT